MFTVNREDVLITFPIEDNVNGIALEIGHDYEDGAYVSFFIGGEVVQTHLTNAQIDDMIWALNEIQSRREG